MAGSAHPADDLAQEVWVAAVRIIAGRGMDRERMGGIVLLRACVQDALAWCLPAVVVAVVTAGGTEPLVALVVQPGPFAGVLRRPVRPRSSGCSSRSGRDRKARRPRGQGIPAVGGHRRGLSRQVRRSRRPGPAGFDTGRSPVLGALLNARGPTEPVVLGMGLELEVIDHRVFTATVVTAVVATVMTGPLPDVVHRRYAPRTVDAEQA
jgi:Kef-type K+ transport system membrane component KefB